MKLLFSTADRGELGRLIKGLLWARIPCAVCRDPVKSHLSVWIQRDEDFPLALHVFTHRHTTHRLPHWARALDPAPPARRGLERLSGRLVLATQLTRTGTACVSALRPLPHQDLPTRTESLQIYGTL